MRPVSYTHLEELFHVLGLSQRPAGGLLLGSQGGVLGGQLRQGLAEGLSPGLQLGQSLGLGRLLGGQGLEMCIRDRGRPKALANSQSRVSWAGTAMMAPVP